MPEKGVMICTALNPDETIAQFNDGKYLVIYDETKKYLAVQVRNPVLAKKNKRFRFVKECLNLNANVIYVPRGSLSFSASRAIKKAGAKAYVVTPGGKFPDSETAEPSFGEVFRSSLHAFAERFRRKH